MSRAKLRRERLRMVERYRKSGLSPKEFAAQEGITTETLRKWRRLAGEAVAGARFASPAASPFVEVAVPAAPPAAPEASSAIEVTLAAGDRIRIPASMPADQIAVILRGIKAC